MDYRRFNNTIVLRLEKGEEIIESINELCIKEKIKAGTITGLGATNDITIGLFKIDEKKYYSNSYKEDFEITNLTGNISVMNDKPYLHIHGTFGRVDGSCVGGHLNKAVISATCEIFITVIDANIGRKFDENIGLNLIEF